MTPTLKANQEQENAKAGLKTSQAELEVAKDARKAALSAPKAGAQ